MLSLPDALSFSFCKRSFVLGTILLFVMLLSIFGLGEFFWYMYRHNIAMNEKDFLPWAFVLYSLQVLGYAILFSYLFIRAKQNVYNQSAKFSSEFFIRVCLTFFALSVISGVGLYLAMPYIQRFLMNSIISLGVFHPFPWGKFILQILLPALGCTLLFGYLWSAVYMAYIMHFNFQRFGYKFLQVLKHPLIYLQILGWGILLILITFSPVFALTFIGSMGQLFAYMMGASGSILFYAVLALFAGSLIIAFIFTKTGRLATLLFTLFYFSIFALIWIVLKQNGLPFNFSAIPVKTFLYLYLFCFILCSMIVMMTIILPTGLIHLMTQGAFQIHKTFEPTVDKQNQIPAETTQKDDGWL